MMINSTHPARRAALWCLLLLTMLLAPLTAMAQNGLEVNKVFGHGLGKNSGVTETLLRGGSLQDYGLSCFRSIVLAPEAMHLAPMLERAIETDGKKAEGCEGQRKNGRIYYSFYTLPSTKSGEHRYLFYLDRTVAGGTGVTLIYMEGTATYEEIRQLLK